MEEKLKKQLGDMIFMIIVLQEQLDQAKKALRSSEAEIEKLKVKNAKG